MSLRATFPNLSSSSNFDAPTFSNLCVCVSVSRLPISVFGWYSLGSRFLPGCAATRRESVRKEENRERRRLLERGERVCVMEEGGERKAREHAKWGEWWELCARIDKFEALQHSGRHERGIKNRGRKSREMKWKVTESNGTRLTVFDEMCAEIRKSSNWTLIILCKNAESEKSEGGG